MGLFQWFSEKTIDEDSPDLSQSASEFLEGKRNYLTSADVDPEGAENYNRYGRAMALKKDGKFSDAAELLLKSCEPPSIYTGHYKELFKIWRQFNRVDLKAHRYQEVVGRVLKMIRFDDEMIREMVRYWSIQQNRKLTSDYFDNDRNLLVSDVKVLYKASVVLRQKDNMQLAANLIERFTKKKV